MRVTAPDTQLAADPLRVVFSSSQPTRFSSLSGEGFPEEGRRWTSLRTISAA